MNKFITISTSTAVLSGLLLITGCSSGGGGGPALPASAVAIDATNAFTLVQAAMAATDAINMAAEDNAELNTCLDGSSSSTVTQSVSGATFTASGTVTLVDCGVYVSILPDTYLVDGPLNYSETFTINADATGTFSGSTSGSVSLTTGNDSVSVTGFTFSATGTENFTTGSESWSGTVQFSYDSLTLGNGFSVQTTTAIAGDASACANSGVVLVTGAANSQARATFNADDSVLVEYNIGDGVWTTETLYPDCGSFMN